VPRAGTSGISNPGPIEDGSGASVSQTPNIQRVTGDDTEQKNHFLKFLISNFEDLVINYLDHSVRNAFIQQKKIEDEKEFKRIKLAVETRVLDLLLNHGTWNEIPNAAYFRQIVGVLANRYPDMFLEDPMVTVGGITVRRFAGKGVGGFTGISSLPKALRQKFTRLVENKTGVVKKKTVRDLPDGTSVHQVPLKKKKVYGIPSEKYYVSSTEEKDNFFAELENVENPEEREAIFSQNRNNLQHALVSSRDIFTAVPLFFSDLVHVERHFEWLTGKSLASSIQQELPRQFKLVKAVVLHTYSTKEFRLHLEIAKIKGAELNGSFIPEFICLLRQLNVQWHHTPGGLLRFPNEPEPSSPHIFCSEGVASLKFDLHFEMKKIFNDLNFSEVLRAFFSLAFIGNLHYPEEGESVAILLQRKVAGITCDGKKIFLNCIWPRNTEPIFEMLKNAVPYGIAEPEPQVTETFRRSQSRNNVLDPAQA
jgi:hypothetical protein